MFLFEQNVTQNIRPKNGTLHKNPFRPNCRSMSSADLLLQSQYSLTETKFEQKLNLFKWLGQRLSMHRKKSQEEN